MIGWPDQGSTNQSRGEQKQLLFSLLSLPAFGAFLPSSVTLGKNVEKKRRLEEGGGGDRNRSSSCFEFLLSAPPRAWPDIRIVSTALATVRAALAPGYCGGGACSPSSVLRVTWSIPSLGTFLDANGC